MKLSRGARLLFQLPTTSRVINKLHPKTQWGWQEVLANKTNFLLETLIWQNATPPKNAKAGDKAKHKASQPKPFLPDFMKDTEKKSPINDGSVAMDVHEIQQMLSLPRA